MNCFNKICPICLVNPDKDTIIIKTPCNHFICFTCLENGGYELRNCPLCRFELFEAIGIQNGKEIFKLDQDNCPHCIMKKYKEKGLI